MNQGICLLYRSYYLNLIKSFTPNTIQGIRLLYQSHYSSQIFKYVLTEYT